MLTTNMTDRERFDMLAKCVTDRRGIDAAQVAAVAGVTAETAETILTWGRVRGMISFNGWFDTRPRVIYYPLRDAS